MRCTIYDAACLNELQCSRADACLAGDPSVPPLEIRSSWTIGARGFATRVDAKALPPDPREGNNGYRCSRCGERGHCKRTCGRKPKR